MRNRCRIIHEKESRAIDLRDYRSFMISEKKLTGAKMKEVFRPTSILLTILSVAGSSLAVELETIYEWRYINYVWRSERQRSRAIRTGEYDYRKIITYDFQKISVLVTTPRFSMNPASLSIVSRKTGPGGPLLEPYPSWRWHKVGNCRGITSVSRLLVDECNRLWIVDSGKIGNQQICPAQILAFDPETDKLLQRVTIPYDLTHSSVNSTKGRLELQAVKTEGDYCEKTWLYIGDPEDYGLVIWDGLDIWRLEHDPVYAPDPTATTFSIAGQNVTLELGVASLLLPPPGFIRKEYLLFKPTASQRGFAATLHDLHRSKIGRKVTYYRSNYTIPSQELGRAYSKYGVLMAGFGVAVACWDLQYPLETDSVGIIAENNSTLQYTSAVKINAGPLGSFECEDYWVMTNRLHQFVQGIMEFTDINFRIQGANLATLVAGTVCEPKPHTIVSTIEDKFFFEFEDQSKEHYDRILIRAQLS